MMTTPAGSEAEGLRQKVEKLENENQELKYAWGRVFSWHYPYKSIAQLNIHMDEPVSRV